MNRAPQLIDLRYCALKLITYALYYKSIQGNPAVPNRRHLAYLLFEMTTLHRDIITIVHSLCSKKTPERQRYMLPVIYRLLWLRNQPRPIHPIGVSRRFSLDQLQAFAHDADENIGGVGLDIDGPCRPFSLLEMVHHKPISTKVEIRREYKVVLMHAMDYVLSETVRLAALGSDAPPELRPILFMENIVLMEPRSRTPQPPTDQKSRWRKAKMNNADANHSFDGADGTSCV